MTNMDIEKETAEKIFKEMIIPQIIGNALPEEKKQAFILGGQPGSGKSSFAREVLKVNKNIVFINGDDLRAYHPKYYFYLKENDKEAADMTQAVCNYWIESLIQECIVRSLDFIVEGTMRKTDVPMRTATMLHEAGYFINLVVISTPYELSLKSLEYRYQELKKLGQPARFTKRDSHDEAYRNLEGTLVSLFESQLFKRFFVYTRDYSGFKESIFEVGEQGEALQIFKEGRSDLLDNRERHVEREVSFGRVW